MPELVLRGLSRDLVARVKAYAEAREMSMKDAARELLARGLDDVNARKAVRRAFTIAAPAFRDALH